MVHLLLWIFVLIICIPLIIILRLLYFLGIVKPRKLDHPNLISGRLNSVRKKLDGIILEIEEDDVISSEEMVESSSRMLKKANETDKKVKDNQSQN